MKKILIAEDSLALGNLLQFVLENAGYEVTLRRNGQAALEAANSSVFDLVILDHQMPKKTGVEVLHHMRETDPEGQPGPNLNTPVFMCTAKSHELDSEQLIQDYRISGIIQKPFSPKALLQELEAAPSSTTCG